MPTLGPKFPTTATQDASGTDAWTAGTKVTGGAATLDDNIAADDATNTAGFVLVQNRAGDSSNVLTVAGFDLSSIPDNATITGIQVALEADGASGSGTAAPTFTITVKGATKTFLGPGRSTAWTVYTVGGAADTWGIAAGSLTGAAFKSGFSVGVKTAVAAGASGQTQTKVDYVTVTVTYTVPAGGQPKVWTGAAFAKKPIKVWNGTAWVTKPLKRWNGTAWVTLT